MHPMRAAVHCVRTTREHLRTTASTLALPFQPALLQVYQSEVEVIEGSLPADLSGVFLRNGPNPKLPVDGGYHW